MKTLSILLIGLALCSCEVAGGNRNQGTWVIASLGTDVGTRNISADGMSETNVNQSASFGVAAKTVRQLWHAYITAEGLKFISGQYYDSQNRVVDADKTVQLEKLRNARDAEAGKRAIEELKITTEAGVAP